MTRALLFGLPIIVLAALFFIFATMLGRDPNLVPSVLINQPAPQFALGPIEGYPEANGGFATQDLTGSVAVVNVFASWCLPCRDEHPLLIKLADDYPDIKLFGINQRDQPDQAIAFLEELGNPYDRIGADNNGRASIEWGVYGVPETFVIAGDGTVVLRHAGPITASLLETVIKPAIAKAAGG